MVALNDVTLSLSNVSINAGSPTAVKALERYDIGVIQVDFSESRKE